MCFIFIIIIIIFILYDFQIVKFIKSITERVLVLIISLSESLKRVLCVKKGDAKAGRRRRRRGGPSVKLKVIGRRPEL